MTSARPDQRPHDFKGERTIYHVDVEAGEINNRVKGCLPVLADLRAFLEQAARVAGDLELGPRPEWLAEIAELRRRWPDISELNAVPGINPNAFMHQLSEVSRTASAFVVDVGQHQMWAAQSLDLARDQRFLTSGGMGSMGFALAGCHRSSDVHA